MASPTRISRVFLRLIRSTPANPIRTTISPVTFFVRSDTLNRPNYWISRYSTSGIDLSNEESKRALFNRLLYRSKQRGFLELDLVLGNWVEENIRSLDESGIESLVRVLDLENPDLWKWLTGQEQPPEEVNTNPVFCAVQEKVLKNLNSYAAPETRSIPGQAWVRGWDDFKKGRDSPISVTNAPRANAELILSILQLSDFFPVLIIWDECERAKHYPDPYLKALEVLKVSKDHTFVFEDSASGIKAGVAAGMPVVDLATQNPEHVLMQAKPTFLIKDYEDPKLWEALEELDKKD